jgi:16S rRNA (cytosine967-C5)-methyltransferase
VKPGGSLVYSVCSLEPEEGEEVVAGFLASRSDYAPDPIRQDEIPDEMPVKEGRLRILPGTFSEQGGADGFFIARFKRIFGG